MTEHRSENPLSEGQRQVLQMIADGHHTKYIATIRHVSRDAISMMVKRAMDNTGTKTAAALIARALRQHWIT